ncbi:hypothetical protein [Sorangium sp. So ce145]|uniref:hypothetical protein n=1 Tax=Sorangium sp. So ce145 TaxID=3133285 RepID=UPI003F5F9D5A
MFEAASYNPMLSGAAGGTQLQVREGDLQRVEGLLEVHPGEAASNDDEESGQPAPRIEDDWPWLPNTRIAGNGDPVSYAFGERCLVVHHRSNERIRLRKFVSITLGDPVRRSRLQ